MKHLTVDEIIDFVSINTIDTKSMELADHINMHIRKCNECLTKVNAFQLIYDEMNKIGSVGNLKSFIYKIASDEEACDHEKEPIENILSCLYEQN